MHRCYFELVSAVVRHEEIRPEAGAGLHASICYSFRGRLTAASPWPWELRWTRASTCHPGVAWAAALLSPHMLTPLWCIPPSGPGPPPQPDPRASVLAAKDWRTCWVLHSPSVQPGFRLYTPPLGFTGHFMWMVKMWSLLWIAYSKRA